MRRTLADSLLFKYPFLSSEDTNESDRKMSAIGPTNLKLYIKQIISKRQSKRFALGPFPPSSFFCQIRATEEKILFLEGQFLKNQRLVDLSLAWYFTGNVIACKTNKIKAWLQSQIIDNPLTYSVSLNQFYRLRLPMLKYNLRCTGEEKQA